MLNQFNNRKLTFEPTQEYISEVALGWEQYLYDRLHMDTTNTSLENLGRPKWALLVGGGSEMITADPNEMLIKMRMLFLHPKTKELYERAYLLFKHYYESDTPEHRRYYYKDPITPYAQYYNRLSNQNGRFPEERKINRIQFFKELVNDLIDRFKEKNVNCVKQTTTIVPEESSKQLHDSIMQNPKLAEIVKQFTPELSKHMEAQAAAILKGFKTMNDATKIVFLTKYAAARGVVITSLPSQENALVNQADASACKREYRPSLSK